MVSLCNLSHITYQNKTLDTGCNILERLNDFRDNDNRNFYCVFYFMDAKGNYKLLTKIVNE